MNREGDIGMLEMSFGPRIDSNYCKGCGKCYEECPMDVFGWDKKKKAPTVDYPGECRFCCACELICPEIAIDVKLPLHMMFEFGIYPMSKKE
jgi:NAD-dependent dihydropyrimidine dehydrogenase PreA subunit